MESHTSDSKKPSAAHATKPHAHANPAQLLSSAKVVAGAAKSTLRHENVDKAKVAGAAADLLGAASHYGKMEEKSYGKYVQQAESYLHGYNNSSQPAAHSSSDAPATHASSTHGSSQAGSHSEGGFGDYMKLAQGLLKKH